MWVTDLQTLKEFITLVLVYAPDLPEEDYLTAEEQLNMQKAMSIIADGLRFSPRLKRDQQLMNLARRYVNEATALYNNDDVKGGGDALWELEKLLKGR